jgi:hypothetical protein
LPTSPFNWGWDEDQSRKVVSILTFTILILNNVIVNLFISFKGVRVELFSPPPKPLGCDFKQWIDDYMIVKDKEYVAWVKKCSDMRKGVSRASSHIYCTLF